MADLRYRPQTQTQAGGRAVSIDEGLRSYMMRIYNLMALGVAVTAVVTLYVANNPALMQKFGHNLEKAWFDYESGRYVPPPPRTPPAGKKYHGFQ